MSDDFEYFKANPDQNMRIRLPEPGEVEALMVRAFPALALDVAQHGGTHPPPDERQWAVAVIAVDRNTILRALVVKSQDWQGGPSETAGWSGAIACFGARAIVDTETTAKRRMIVEPLRI